MSRFVSVKQPDGSIVTQQQHWGGWHVIGSLIIFSIAWSLLGLAGGWLVLAVFLSLAMELMIKARARMPR